MEEQQFDELTKKLAASVSRRTMIKVVVATALGSVLPLRKAAPASAALIRECGKRTVICAAGYSCIDPRTCACAPGNYCPGATPSFEVPANCCGGTTPLCCPPNRQDPCCPSYPSSVHCCDPGDARPCCGLNFSDTQCCREGYGGSYGCCDEGETCCKRGSGRDCCPKEAPVCCPNTTPLVNGIDLGHGHADCAQSLPRCRARSGRVS